MALDLTWGAPFTEDDLANRPDDGHRYELVDGTLLVTPSPSPSHQTCVTAIWALLHASRTPSHRVFVAPLDVRLSATTVLQPDVLVARATDVTRARLEGAPVLAVEVLSANTRAIDLGAKRLAYEEAAIPAYWLVDPDAPRLTVLHLEEGRYVEHAVVTGEEAYEAEFPFPAIVTPARLIEP
jgi:Uma2 family endonuclease